MRLALIVLALVLLAVGIYLLRAPGGRGQLKAWAAANGFEVVPSVPGFPASPAARGIVGGYEAAAGNGLCGLRRDESAGPSVTFTRGADGFSVEASEPAGRRFLDSRVDAALATFPAEVTRVSVDGEWVRAEGSPDAFESLQLLADAAYALPPAGGYRERTAPESDPTRPVRAIRAQRDDQGVDKPKVELPQRAVGATLGQADDYVVAADDVVPIADGSRRIDPAPQTGPAPAKATRKMEPSSIFDEGCGTLDS